MLKVVTQCVTQTVDPLTINKQNLTEKAQIDLIEPATLNFLLTGLLYENTILSRSNKNAPSLKERVTQ